MSSLAQLHVETDRRATDGTPRRPWDPLQSVAPITDREYAILRGLLKSTCGVNLGSHKKHLLQARLCRRLQGLKLTSYDQYIRHLKKDRLGNELVELLNALTTNVTEFFRQNDQFEYLQRVLLPQKLARAHKASRRLRIWSAGCSSGEEPYSIAMVMAATIPYIRSWDTAILATDLSTKVLAGARKGIYTADRLGPVPWRLRSRYFARIPLRHEKLYRACDELRQLLHFRQLNLIDAWPMQGMFDAIFCRNVMMYFDQQLQQQLLARLAAILAPGGTLFVGFSECLDHDRHNLKPIAPAIYRKSNQL